MGHSQLIRRASMASLLDGSPKVKLPLANALIGHLKCWDGTCPVRRLTRTWDEYLGTFGPHRVWRLNILRGKIEKECCW